MTVHNAYEAFRMMRRERQRRTAKRREDFPEQAASHSLLWRKRHETHWQYPLCGDLLDFWPGPNKWRWRGKTYSGEGHVFDFIRKQEYIIERSVE